MIFDSVVWEPRRLGLLITYNCNARCKMCCWSCSPKKKKEMTLHDIKNYVNQAKDISSIEYITLTGGEPFLHFDKLQNAIAYISDCGFKPSVVTNCFWANDYENALNILHSLAEKGLQRFRISADEFHLEFVPLENVIYALRAAKELGLDIGIGSVESKKLSKNYREILDQAVGLDGIEYLEFKLSHAGRAVKLSNEYFDYLQGNESKIGCNVVESPLIKPNGNVYPCCMVPLSENLILGNLHNSSNTLYELLNKASNSTLITALALYGSIKLYERFTWKPWFKNRTPFVNECEVCNWLLSEKNISAFIAMLEKSKIEILAARTIIESEK